MWTLALFLILCKTSVALNVTRVPDGVPILYNKLANAHISFDTFRMIYSINLTDYYQLEQQIDSAISELTNRCQSKKKTYEHCRLAIMQLENRLHASTLDDDNLKGYRSKRFCNWCGNLLHSSTGVVNAETAEIWTDFMNKVKNETTLQAIEIFNQTAIFKSFMDATDSAFNRTQRALNQLQKSLNTFASFEETAMEQIHDRLLEQEIFQLAESALIEHERMYRKLRSAMESTKRGRIPELIVRKKLAKHLNDISLTLPSEQRLPLDPMKEDPLHIFSFADIFSVLHESHLLITIIIPIAERERYSLYKATAVPMLSNKQLFITKITTEHFLLNSEGTKFIAMDSQELANGRTRSPREVLYRPSASIITNKDIICEWKVFSELETSTVKSACEFVPVAANVMIVAVMANEQYFVATPNGLTIRETCGLEEKNIFVKDRSLIAIETSCSIKTANFEIKAHKTHIVNTTLTLLPDSSAARLLAANLPKLSTGKYTKLILNTTAPIIIHDAAEMNDIIGRAEDLLKQTDHEFKLNDLKYETTGWSIGLVIAIAAVVVVAAVEAFIFFKKFNVMSIAMDTLEKSTDQIPRVVQSLAPAAMHSWMQSMPALNLVPLSSPTTQYPPMQMIDMPAATKN